MKDEDLDQIGAKDDGICFPSGLVDHRLNYALILEYHHEGVVQEKKEAVTY